MHSVVSPKANVEFQLAVSVQIAKHRILDTLMLNIAGRIAKNPFPLTVEDMNLRTSQGPSNVVSPTTIINLGL